MVELVDLVRPESYRHAFMQGLTFHQLSLGSGHRSEALGKEKLVAAGMSFSKLLEEGTISVPALRCVTVDEVGPADRPPQDLKMPFLTKLSRRQSRLDIVPAAL